MKNLFRNLAPYKLTAVLILLLMLGQAFCDMNLPMYTQNMIDVGIQNKGVESILPEKITGEEFLELEKEATPDIADRLRYIYQVEGLSDNQIKSMTLEQNGAVYADEEFLPAVIARYTGDDIDKYIDKEAQKAGLDTDNETVMAMGIAYAVQCDKDAGVDVDKIQHDYMWKCGIMMFIMSIAILVITALASFLSARVGAGIGRDLRGRLFNNVIAFSSAEIEKFQTSSLITRATNDIQQVQMTCTMMLRMVLYAPCICTWAIIKVYQTHGHMNFIIVIGVIAILTLVGLIFAIAMPKFKIMQKLVDALNAVSREMLTGIQVIRAFGREKTEEERFDKANGDLFRNQLFVNRTMTAMTPVMMIVMYGLTIWITWVASHRIDAGIINVGTMTAFIAYSMEIVFSFLMISGMAIFLPRAGVAADRVYEVLNTHTSIEDAKSATELTDVKGEVHFDHVSFMYPDAEENVLTDIDFVARPGETTAIIGSTGCGKSTVVNLIPRFYDVTEGSIKIDGKDIRGVKLHSLRDAIGYVAQKGVLFSGTIESNIRFGRPDADDEEVRDAAVLAQATEFIEQKDEKYDSFISQGGSNVSGGQKQRLSIARALIKKSPILIFDDSFSALDMKTDAELRKALNKDAKNATKIIVAQRVGTILHAEQIIVLDDGRIVGKGTHQELMKTCPIYADIARSQLSEKELKEA